jgi:hypothetical protein
LCFFCMIPLPAPGGDIFQGCFPSEHHQGNPTSCLCFSLLSLHASLRLVPCSLRTSHCPHHCLYNCISKCSSILPGLLDPWRWDQ